MSKLIQELIEYLSNATPEQLEKDRLHYHQYSSVGPTIDEFLNNLLGQVNYKFNTKNPEFSLDFLF